MGFVGPEKDIIDDMSIKLDPRGNMETPRNHYTTSVPKVYAAGGEIAVFSSQLHLHIHNSISTYTTTLFTLTTTSPLSEHLHIYKIISTITTFSEWNICTHNHSCSIITWAMSQENLFSGFPTRWDSNRPFQLQRLARVLDIETRGIILSKQETTKALIRLCGCAGWSALFLFAYGTNRFSHDVAYIIHNYLSSNICRTKHPCIMHIIISRGKYITSKGNRSGFAAGNWYFVLSGIPF